ncbi:transposase family protein [Treponema pedis]|uniref:transposase family protein n=1 Tax=Treponema pedis TaxID=409322 RepID=UPI001C079DB0
MSQAGRAIAPEIKATLSQISDFRQEHGKKHALVDILLLCVIGFICGHTDKHQSFGQNMK